MTEVRKQIDREQEQATTTTTTTTYHTEPGVLCAAGDLEQIRIAYNSILGQLNSIKAQDIERALQWIDASAVIDAIEQTAMAERPTHYYLRAILRRYEAEGLTTAEKCSRDRRERRQKQQRAKWQREEWFERREDMTY